MGLLSSGLAASLFLAVAACSSGHRTSGAVVLRGHGSQTVAPFTLSQNSDLIWSCPRCSFFSIEAPHASVYDLLPVNVLRATRGTSFLEAGRFKGVQITAEGMDARPRWAVTLTRATARPIRSSTPFQGPARRTLRPSPSRMPRSLAGPAAAAHCRSPSRPARIRCSACMGVGAAVGPGYLPAATPR